MFFMTGSARALPIIQDDAYFFSAEIINHSCLKQNYLQNEVNNAICCNSGCSILILK